MPPPPPRPVLDDPLLGQTLGGKYRVEERIGRGGMGVVYRARHLALDRDAALKVVRRGAAVDARTVARFHAEARATSRLRHPHIVAVTDFGEAQDGTLFMVMEHIPGRTLAEVVADEAPLPERRAVDVGAQILAAVAEAHAHGVLHRDLKPSNVMVEPSRHGAELAKVLDFGIATAVEPPVGRRAGPRAGTVCGTHGYMSPEQAAGEPLDVRSDLYSLGVVLHEMLTGELPPLGRAALRCALLRNAGVSPRVERIVVRALSPAREGRPGSAEEMRRELVAASAVPGRAGPPRAAATLDQAVLERARLHLADRMGPLAAFVVDRVAPRARDGAHLYEVLGLEGFGPTAT